MPIDYLKKRDLSAYKQSIDKLNRSLYSELKQRVNFVGILDSYFLSSALIDRCMSHAILHCIFLVLLFIAHEFSLINLQTAFLPLIPCLLIQISLSYVLLTKDDNIKSCLFALIVLPIFVLLRLCEHCLWLFILCLTNFVYIINFIFETSLKAAQIPAAIGFLAFWFYYFLRAVEFENLSTVILITLFASTLSSIICTKRILFEEEFSKSMVNQVTIFVVSFVGFIGMLKCRFDPVHCTIIVGVTTTFIVALYSYYKLFLSSKFKLGTK